MDKEESANIFLDADDLFGVPPPIVVDDGSRLAQDNDWGRQGLAQWFDGAIDVEGAAGVQLVDPHNWRLAVEEAPAVGYENLWSGIEEPRVLGSRSGLDHDLERYTREVENPKEGSTVSISAADMLQLPLMRNKPQHSMVSYPIWSNVHTSHGQVSTISNGPAPFSTQEAQELESSEDEQEEEMMYSQVDSIDMALEIFSDSLTSISLEEESDDDSLEIVAYRPGHRSSSPRQISQVHTAQYEMAHPAGSGRVVREKMMYEWLHKSESTVIIPDGHKRREMERLTMGNGPRDLLQPLEGRQQPGDSRWAEQLLNLCAGAIASRDIGRTQHLMWVLNELASFTGDGNQRLAAYGLKALFCKITGGKEAAATWMRPFHHQEKTLGPKAVHRALVTFHEFNLWHQVAYTVTNETLLEVFAGKSRLHIVDVGIIKGLQWPILIDALANRQGGPPSKLRITTVRHHNVDAQNSGNNQVDADSADFMKRLVTFAKVLGLDCELDMYVGPLESITKEDLKLEEGEVKQGKQNETLIYMNLLCFELRIDQDDDPCLMILPSLESCSSFHNIITREVLMSLSWCVQAGCGGLLSISFT